jgi:hypothetical protein
MGDRPGSHRYKVITEISKKIQRKRRNSKKKKKIKENKNKIKITIFFDFFKNSFLLKNS